jgi:Polysaccharide deacetylase
MRRTSCGVSRALWRLVAVLALLPFASAVYGRSTTPPVYVTLWFDTEDYILPQDDDAAKRVAEILTSAGVRATFKIVGEKARVLEQRGRTDVIAALKKHEIGYHSNTHSGQPTIAVYLQHAGWDDGVAEFYRREEQGVRDVTRIFGTTPTCYGQPGAAWAPQSYAALAKLGIGMYLDEADHVGIDDQPFYFDGMLNVFKMRSMLARMELTGSGLAQGKATFMKAYEALRARGGGTISVYYHPNEWVQTEFWDGVNFRDGANPPRSQWRPPGTRPPAETEAAFRDFAAYLEFMKAQPGVRFVTASDLMRIYKDAALSREFNREDLAALARGVGGEITFQKRDGYVVSAADVFVLLNTALESFFERQALVQATPLETVYGPAREFKPSEGAASSRAYSWTAFAEAVRGTGAYVRLYKQMPAEIWIGSESLSPADYLATLAGAFVAVAASGAAPTQVERRIGRFTADQYVAADSPKLWSWPIFPPGFHAPEIMALARLQAWTLKPALLNDN